MCRDIGVNENPRFGGVFFVGHEYATVTCYTNSKSLL